VFLTAAVRTTSYLVCALAVALSFAIACPCHKVIRHSHPHIKAGSKAQRMYTRQLECPWQLYSPQRCRLRPHMTRMRYIRAEMVDMAGGIRPCSRCCERLCSHRKQRSKSTLVRFSTTCNNTPLNDYCGLKEGCGRLYDSLTGRAGLT
jgi:hypothetical protein